MVIYTITHSSMFGDFVHESESLAVAEYLIDMLSRNGVKFDVAYTHTDAPTQLDLPF
jgi:hypothetical protein